MPDARAFATVSLTELPQYGRMVEFLVWARDYAEESCDGPLLDHLDELAGDLREMNRKMVKPDSWHPPFLD